MDAGNRAVVQRMDWLDYGRFVCALWVMLDHYFVTAVGSKAGRGISDFGLATEIARFGTVSLFVFLMMSGLVITLVAQRQSAADFVSRRAARVYPTFVLCLTITALVSTFGPERFHVSLPQYLAGLAINAPALGYRFVDAVYWTLMIEIVFYGAMLVVMMGGWMRHIERIVAGWVLLQLICVFLPRTWPLVGLDYYFLSAGAVFALHYQRRNDRLTLALLAISLLLCIRCAVNYAGRFNYDPWGSAGLTVVIFAVFLGMRGRTVELPYAHRIGSMTYALYLLHFHIGLTIFSWCIDEGNKWLVVAGVSLLMIAVSFAIDDIMEFRLRPLWVRIGDRSIARPFAWWERRKHRVAPARANGPAADGPAASDPF